MMPARSSLAREHRSSRRWVELELQERAANGLAWWLGMQSERHMDELSAAVEEWRRQGYPA